MRDVYFTFCIFLIPNERLEWMRLCMHCLTTVIDNYDSGFARVVLMLLYVVWIRFALFDCIYNITEQVHSQHVQLFFIVLQFLFVDMLVSR